MKPMEAFFSEVLFIMLFTMVLPFQSLDEILKCDHSNESYSAVLSCGVVYYAVQHGSTFQSMDEMVNQYQDRATRKRCK